MPEERRSGFSFERSSSTCGCVTRWLRRWPSSSVTEYSPLARQQIGAVRLTLTTSLARAFTLTRPPSVGQVLESPLYLPPAALEGLQALEEKEVLSVTTKGRAKAAPPDPISVAIRARWREKCTEAEKLMRRVYVRHPNYHHIVPSLVETGLERLEETVRLTVGIPLSPMLGSITRSLAEVFERLQGVDFTSEAKLDGQRGQIHVRAMRDKEEERLVREEVGSGGMWTALEDGQKVFVRLFSRHLEDMTEKVSCTPLAGTTEH